ncbi:uncharacterized protein LOC129827738 isoform X2 [Salvelinus fontinalis]|uniref:uncharacterized protein LOC129827738 isoform X2 n=1 Tax=Salvelinus fontinalis TaxID=8038 RepID=UPI002485C638|nr:uncharacterized protein LOC129827738 isoform X2 [Salvelinus fontinalis]
MSMGETALESHTTADPWRATRRRIPGEPHDGGSLESHTTADPWRATRRRIPGEPHDGGSLESHTTADPWRATRRRIPGEPHDGGSLESHTTADPWRATRRRIPGEPHDGGSLESHTTLYLVLAPFLHCDSFPSTSRAFFADRLIHGTPAIFCFIKQQAPSFRSGGRSREVFPHSPPDRRH